MLLLQLLQQRPSTQRRCGQCNEPRHHELLLARMQLHRHADQKTQRSLPNVQPWLSERTKPALLQRRRSALELSGHL